MTKYFLCKDVTAISYRLVLVELYFSARLIFWIDEVNGQVDWLAGFRKSKKFSECPQELQQRIEFRF